MLAHHVSFHNAFTSKKYAALCIEVSKRGQGIGMGGVNKKDHMVQLVENDTGKK
jgi:hypothetical protein